MGVLRQQPKRHVVRTGQVTLEYFLLFAIVAMATLLGFTTFDENVRKTCEDFFNAAAADLTN